MRMTYSRCWHLYGHNRATPASLFERLHQGGYGLLHICGTWLLLPILRNSQVTINKEARERNHLILITFSFAMNVPITFFVYDPVRRQIKYRS
jgi:hypothetical protein